MHRPVLEALIESLLEQKRRVAEILASNIHPGGENLHDVRVALRRMAALARLTRGVPDQNSAQSLRRSARDLRRALSPLRTLEISRYRLRRRFARNHALKPLALELASLIFATSSERHEETRERLEDLAGDLDRKFVRRLAELRTLAASSGIPSAEAVESVMKFLISKRIAKMTHQLIASGVPEMEGLHAFRIATKDLRYSIEFLEEFAPEARETRKRLKEFQDVAGDAHDRVELLAIVRHAADEGSETAVDLATPLLPSLEKDMSAALRRSQKLAEKLLSHLRSVDFGFPS